MKTANHIIKWTSAWQGVSLAFFMAMGVPLGLAQETAAPPIPPPPNNPMTAGILQEDANLDADAALSAYREVINRYDQQRPDVAQALFRAAGVCRKKGDLSQARDLYARILREFDDQTDLIAEAKRQLEAVSQPRFQQRLARVVLRGNPPPAGLAAAARGSDHSRWLLNVAFASGLAKLGFAATGNTPNDYWNGYYLPWIHVVPLVNLQLWNRTVTPVSMEVRNAAGAWSNNTGDIMYDSYVYVNDGSDKNIIINITNLPAGKYEFYLYGHADPGGQEEGNSLFVLESAGKKYGPAGTVRSAGWKASEPWEEGVQYVRLRQVEVKEGEPVVVTVMPGQDGQPIDGRNRPPVINGMQIVRLEDETVDDDQATAVAPTPAATALELDHPDSANAQMAAAVAAVENQLAAKTQPEVLAEVQPPPPPPEYSAMVREPPRVAPRETLQRTEDNLRTHKLRQLERDLAQADEEVALASRQHRAADRRKEQVAKFVDQPHLLPRPVADDPRYQKLKQVLDDSFLASDASVREQAKVKLGEWMKEVYLPELKVAEEEARTEWAETKDRQEQIREELSKEHESLRKEMEKSTKRW